MATGAGGLSSFESTVDRRFQTVSNTMDSIQGLSTWCIEKKKYHSLIVRYWMKWLRKSDASHRLNLIYLANDVIQNCKRKNAIVYRTAFTEVLPDAFLLINNEGDSKVIKAVDRILSIWEERSVYTDSLISELRSYLVKEESPPDTPVGQKSPVDSKEALKSKIVAEFVPQALIDQLSKYMRSLEDVELREKQLATMRVDVCSSEALRKLKDKAGGKKFSKDFEEGSAKLQDFVKLFDRQCKGGPPLLEALSNADIFYEMQYKEVKIVANAYQTFAKRVSHLKRKLDTLKATLPDPNESPIPSPSADAPSPEGSDSPYHTLELSNPDPELDGSAMDDEAEPPAPSPLSSPGGSPKYVFNARDMDNRDVEDMEMSEDEMDSGGIIIEEPIECPAPITVADPGTTQIQPSVLSEPLAVAQTTASSPHSASNTANIDLSKIGSLLGSLTSALKNTGSSMGTPSPPASTASSSVVTTPSVPVSSLDASSLANILTQVDITPEELLSALSEVQDQGSGLRGLTSLLNRPAENVSTNLSRTGQPSVPVSSTPALAAPSSNTPLLSSTTTPVASPPVSSVRQVPAAQAAPPSTSTSASTSASALVQALHRDMELTADPPLSSPALSDSLESKIHSFLQDNPGFNAFNLGLSINPSPGGSNHSPLTGTDTRDGTPVRDEGGGTPTQDEIMDKPVSDPFPSDTGQCAPDEAVAAPVSVDSGKLSSSAFPPNLWPESRNPQQHAHVQPGVAQNGQGYQPYPYGSQEGATHGMKAPVVQYQQIAAQGAGPELGRGAPGSANSNKTVAGFQQVRGGGWFGDPHPEGGSLHHSSAAAVGGIENQASGLYPYQADQTQDLKALVSKPGLTNTSSLYQGTLPPVPQLPPPPKGFEAPSSIAGAEMIPPEQQPIPNENREENRVGGESVISGIVIHDHQHKSMFHQDEPPYHPDDLNRHPDSMFCRSDELHRRPDDLHHQPDDFHPHPNDLRYQDERRRYRDELRPHDPMLHSDDPRRHPDDQHFPPDDAYHRPGSPPQRYPPTRGHPTNPISPSEDAYFSHDYIPRSSPSLYGPRRPLPPPLEQHHPRLRPPHRLPHPPHHPYPRVPLRGPPPPPFHGQDPRFRAKRPIPRGGGPGGPFFHPKRPYMPPRF